MTTLFVIVLAILFAISICSLANIFNKEKERKERITLLYVFIISFTLLIISIVVGDLVL